MAKDFVVALELGSSFIRGIAGKKNADGSISILAVAKEPSSSFIQKGYVYNIDRTGVAIRNVIEVLSTKLDARIEKVYVGISGQSIRGIKNKIVRDFPTNTKVTQTMIDDIMDSNRATEYPEKELLECSVQEYKLDNLYQIDPVGIECMHLESMFLNIVSRQTFYSSINKCLETAGISQSEIVLAPFALADVILTDNEKRMGCVLVDLGADTTTVSVYYKNILRHLSVIPIGSNNITRDIETLNIDEDDALWLKTRHASAYTASEDINTNSVIELNSGEKLPVHTLINVVEARVAEIIQNVHAQIPNEYEDKLTGGYILTGGGANMAHIDEAFMNIVHTRKIRIARTVQAQIISKCEEEDFSDGTWCSIIGIMANGTDNCVHNDTGTLNNVFPNTTDNNKKENPNDHQNPEGDVPSGTDTKPNKTDKPATSTENENKQKKKINKWFKFLKDIVEEE